MLFLKDFMAFDYVYCSIGRCETTWNELKTQLKDRKNVVASCYFQPIPEGGSCYFQPIPGDGSCYF